MSVFSYMYECGPYVCLVPEEATKSTGSPGAGATDDL